MSSRFVYRTKSGLVLLLVFTIICQVPAFLHSQPTTLVREKERGSMLEAADFLRMGGSTGGTEGRDNTTAMISLISDAYRLNKPIHFQCGEYWFSGAWPDIVVSGGVYHYVSIIGDGKACVRLMFGPGDYNPISYKGDDSGVGLENPIELRGFEITKGDRLGACLVLKYSAFFSIYNLKIVGCHVGLQVEGGLLFHISDSEFRYNDTGAEFSPEGGKPPNAILLTSNSFSNNIDNGLVLRHPTGVSIVGGDIEGNGILGTEIGRSGVTVDGSPLSGSTALSIHDVYFEYNAGLADLSITHIDLRTAVIFVSGSNFNRIDQSKFVESNIVLSGISDIKLRIESCSFNRLGSYIPSASRPHIYVKSALRSVVTLDASNFQDDFSLEGYHADSRLRRR